MYHESTDRWYFNGIDGATGAPLTPALLADQVARLARGEVWDPEQRDELESWADFVQENHMDVTFGIDPRRLDQTGWGVVFAPDCPDAVREALAPLLELRRERATAGTRETHYRELHYRAGESKPAFLARHGAGPGPANPKVLPYYLLLVGGPEEIPFSFQYQLDLQYAVGRIHFETADDYAHYAATVVAAERGEIVRPRKATFFAVANPDDPATARGAASLADPLADHVASRWPEWEVERVGGERAVKAALGGALTGTDGPAVLLTASHGVGFPPGHPRQRRHQGALLCRDWPGPRQWRAPISEDLYFSADDVGDTVSPRGIVSFHFACYGAGTPERDSFRHRDGGRGAIAPESFVALLPQRLLAHPRGGALAVVGHVDRAWSYSFDWPAAGEQIETFRGTLGRLLEGYPVGAAMEFFNQRYAELSSDLSYRVEESNDETADFMTLAGLWTAHNDARSYVVLGDPAVRLAVATR